MSNHKFERLAQDIFFNGGNIAAMLTKHGMELRPGKTNSDFHAAFHIGIKRGLGKFEREMTEAGMSLAKVCRIAGR